MITTRGWGEAWLAAFGVCGALLVLAGVVHIPITPVTAAAAAMIAIALAIPRKREMLAFPVVPAILALVPLVVVSYAALTIPLHDFDGRAFWLLKAKGIAHDHAIDGPFFRGEEVVDPRNDYPLLVPLDAAAVMLLTHSLDDRNVRFLYLLTFVALVLLVRERIGKLVSPEAGAWCAALVAWIPQFATANEGGVMSAYCDIPLAAFVAAAFFELIEGESPVRFSVWLSFVMLTKNEGLPLAAVLLIAGFFAFRRRVAFALPAPFAAMAALIAWKHRIPHGPEEDLGKLLPTLPQHLDRVPAAIAGFARHLVASPWGLFWVGVVLAMGMWVVGCGMSKDPQPTTYNPHPFITAFVLLGAFATYIAAYSVTTWVQIDLINSSADRLLMHVVGPAVFAISASLRSR